MTQPNKAVFQPWSEEAFQADVYVRGMTAVQRWIYRTLLQAAFDYSTRPHLPNDDEILWVLAGCDSRRQWDKNKGVVLRQFAVLDGNLLEHKRVTADWNKAMDARKRMSMLAKKSHGIDDTFNAGSAHAERTQNESPAQAERTQSVGSASKDKRSKQKESELIVPGAAAPGEESCMTRAAREISTLCRQILGIRPPMPGADSWKEINELAKAYDHDKVVDAFKAWAEQNQGDSRITYPISAFVKVADALLRGTIAVQTPESRLLVTDLVEIAGGLVTFNPGQSAQLARLLKDYSADEVKFAFRSFFERIAGDDFLVKRTNQDFPDQAWQLCDVARREVAQRARDIEGARRGGEEMQRRLEAEIEAKRLRDAEAAGPEVDDDEWETK